MLRWADELYQIYERFCGQPIGGDTAVLLPVAHSTANAQIEVTLSEDGIFQAAKKIEDKKDAVTIIPERKILVLVVLELRRIRWQIN